MGRAFLVLATSVFVSMIGLVILSYIMAALGVFSWSEGTLLQVGVPLGLGIGVLVNVYRLVINRKPATGQSGDWEEVTTVRRRRR